MGETHHGNPLNCEAVTGWVSGSVKQATRLGESAAQTPPGTPDTMKSAILVATEGLDDGEADHSITILMVERLVGFVIMVFLWCTMLRLDNLLGLYCRDMSLAPNYDGGNWAFRARLSVRQKKISNGILAMRHLYRILKMTSAIPVSPSPSHRK